jgi:hypothetical protein
MEMTGRREKPPVSLFSSKDRYRGLFLGREEIYPDLYYIDGAQKQRTNMNACMHMHLHFSALTRPKFSFLF